MAKRDIFRRQYLLGPHSSVMQKWEGREFAGNYVLTAHPDIPVNECCIDNRHLVVIGDILDPDHPSRSNQQVLESIFDEFSSYSSLENSTFKMGGRWLLLANLDDECRVYPDATGSRPIFYSLVDDQIWISSLPSILAKEFGYDQDKSLVAEMGSTEYGDWWPGSLTPYSQISHCGPNHYLDLHRNQAVRFWPLNPLPSRKVDVAANEISRLLSGLMLAASFRYCLYMAVTGGYDSRVLISASKEIHERIKFFTLAYPGIEQFDLHIPMRLAKAFGLNYSVQQFNFPNEEFLEEFDHLASGMVRGQCRMNASSYLDYPNDAMFVEGTASEILRCFYYNDGNHPDVIDPAELSRRAGFAQLPSAIKAFEDWLESVPKDTGMNMLDMFYWEQRVGNWSATDYQTQETVRNVFSPFNCRQLLVAGLGVPVEYRCVPHTLYLTICEQLLPKILRFRFNYKFSPGRNVMNILRKVARRGLRLLGIR